MTLSEGSSLISSGIEVTKTPIDALDGLSWWQISIAFLVLDVILYGLIKWLRGRAMSEGNVVSDAEKEHIDDLIAEQSETSFNMSNTYTDDTWSND